MPDRIVRDGGTRTDGSGPLSRFSFRSRPPGADVRPNERASLRAVGDAWHPDKTNLDATDRKVLADVDEYGWHCLHIHDKDQLPYWAFSSASFRAGSTRSSWSSASATPPRTTY